MQLRWTNLCRQQRLLGRIERMIERITVYQCHDLTLL